MVDFLVKTAILVLIGAIFILSFLLLTSKANAQAACTGTTAACTVAQPYVVSATGIQVCTPTQTVTGTNLQPLELDKCTVSATWTGGSLVSTGLVASGTTLNAGSEYVVPVPNARGTGTVVVQCFNANNVGGPILTCPSQFAPLGVPKAPVLNAN